MRILLTGANGLLGKCFQHEITKLADTTLYVTGNNDLSNNAVKIDITDFSSVKEATADLEITHIINCAADRAPESCLNNPATAYALNAGGVENLARLAGIKGATLCHISTDYVFDGTTPPYTENDCPAPVNVYGRSKLAGEVAARTAEKHLILRIPALYRSDITDSRNLLNLLHTTLTEGKEIAMDNSASRYYTLADEVATAALLLLQQKVNGTVHLSAQECSSKADFARIFARNYGFNENLITNIDKPDPAGENRPEDSHLSTTKFESLTDFKFTPPSKAIHK